MSAHSPGPWRVREPCSVVDSDGILVADAYEEDATRLISAAPEMLALLREAGQWYCGEMPDGTDRREAIAALLARIDGAAKDAEPADAENADDGADYDGCPNCGAWNRNACGCRR